MRRRRGGGLMRAPVCRPGAGGLNGGRTVCASGWAKLHRWAGRIQEVESSYLQNKVIHAIKGKKPLNSCSDVVPDG